MKTIPSSISGSEPETNFPGKTPVYNQTQAPSANVLGANERIAVAIVGVGFGNGQNHLIGIHLKSKENNVAIAAACDVFEKRRAFVRQRAELKGADVCLDYRHLLERSDIDAVLVATHDPLHARISLDSLDAGKHVYCERPLTRYLSEAFQVYDKVKSSRKTFQLGVQSCSAGAWQKCAELVRAGKLGTLVWSQSDYCRNGGPGCDGYGMIEEGATPAAIDWEKWLGPVPWRPFSAAHFHQWRLYSDYSAGLLAGQAAQRLHPLMLASGKPEFPVRVNCVSAHRFQDRSFKPQPGSKQVPAHVELVAEFPHGQAITITCSWLNAKGSSPALYGHKASLSIGVSGERVELVPEREFAHEVTPETYAGLPPDDIRAHEKNWFDCIRSGKRPSADIDLAIRGQTVLSLAEMSDRLKVTCLFDEKTRKVTDSTGKEITPLTYGTSESI